MFAFLGKVLVFFLSVFVTPKAYVGAALGVIFSPALRKLPLFKQIVAKVEYYVAEIAAFFHRL